MRSIPTLALLSMLLALPAFAGDGVLEINQTCAVQTGCFAGDAAGFPVSINGIAGRSYRLTSDLVVPSENSTGILISAQNISIDLAGFEIGGPVVCSGAPLNCVPDAGTGMGIDVAASQLSGISVRNGTIRGMGAGGLFLGPKAEVARLRVRSNRGSGIDVGAASTVSDNIADQNSSQGIHSPQGGSTVTGNTVSENGFDGIGAGAGSTVSGNTAYENQGDGISSGAGSTVSGNTAYRNEARGLEAGAGSNLSGNTAYQNTFDGIFSSFGSTISGNTVYANAGDGIETGAGSTVLGNTVRQSTGFGLNLGLQSGYRENVLTNNTGGTVNGASAVNLGNNLCNGSTTCP